MCTCENCGGEGGFTEIVSGWRYEDYFERWIDCPACGGSGWVYAEPPQLTMEEVCG